FDESPMFTGRIKSVGPRYCPSVEDKINRFKDKTRHQIFVEPEGWNTVEGYVNGFSTSLPEEVQFKAIRLIPGFEKAKLFRPGYAIEYDYFPPTQLKFTLETKLVENLYFAGQINGTTGYEEAGAQGLIAGINAHRKVHGDKEFILRRNDAYIGVLIDDIINKGVDEPYRMFTSRAEFRTLLRQDNADLRLTKIGYELGLAKKDRYDSLLEKERNIEKLNQILNDLIVPMKDLNEFLVENGEKELKERKKLSNLLLRPGITINKMAQAIPSLGEKIEGLDSSVIQQVEIQNKYESYIKKENEMVIKMSQMENLIIPDNFNYDKVHALNTEARIRLMEVQPKTMGQASRIRGVNPSDIQILMIYMGR
ncbi:MAG TPA: FAD-dependent oxidoreductase, partial [Chitinophagaceae bacterium]|nr:FAD-dependent oxidoreductase [Chitinophagaceae bacterium]